MQSNNLDKKKLLCSRKKGSNGDKDVNDKDSECSRK